MTLLDKLRWPLFAPGDAVLVAVSGGPDSLCLLHLLWTERTARGLGSVEAAHLDHGLRGDESAAEADWVQGWCGELGIVCHTGRANLETKRGRSVQEAAREARYAFLAETADAVGADKIATGHTKNDQAETVLANILRGTGTSGLRGIPGRRGRIVRPLLDVSRAEIEVYNDAHGLTPRQDSSNLSTAHYTRNHIRLELLPALRRDYNERVDDALVRLSEIAARDNEYLAAQAAAALAGATMAATTHGLTLDRAALRNLHPAPLRYAVREAIAAVRGTGAGVGYEALEAVCAAIGQKGQSQFALTLPRPACTVRVTAAAVTLESRPAERPGAVFVPLPVPGTAHLVSLGRSVSAGWQDRQGAVRMDAGGVDLGTLHVRNWVAGDKIDPLGMGGNHKKLSDLFAAAGVPRPERDFVPVVADAHGILWVAGYRQSERAKVTLETDRVLYLSAEAPAEGNDVGDVE